MSNLPPLRAACVQFCATVHCAKNLELISSGITQAAEQGAELIQLPEMANLMQVDKTLARQELEKFSSTVFLESLQELALHYKVWLHIGSLIVPKKQSFYNRGYLIDSGGSLRGKYDKIHLFDVDLENGESYRESSSFIGGKKAVVVDTPWGGLGMAICFDLRYPHLYQSLAEAGATILTAPAAFTATTGAAHWQTLVQARAIENNALMLACGQVGLHQDGRKTYGHSLMVDAWGKILAQGSATDFDIVIADFDPNQPASVRKMIPTAKLKKTFRIQKENLVL